MAERSPAPSRSIATDDVASIASLTTAPRDLDSKPLKGSKHGETEAGSGSSVRFLNRSSFYKSPRQLVQVPHRNNDAYVTGHVKPTPPQTGI